MIAFEVAIDGQPRCTAGVRDLGVASVLASWVRRAPRDPGSGEPVPGRLEEELTLEVGGLWHEPDGAAVHVTWLQEPLNVGQRITLTIVNTAEVDPPRSREREDPERTERQKRAYYERLEQQYGDA